MLADRILNSGKTKRAAKAAVFAGIMICFILLLPPIQKKIISLINTETSPLLSLPFAAQVIFIFALCCLYAKNIFSFLDNSVNLRLVYAVTIAAIMLTLGYIGFFSYRHGWQWLDSDHASEMVLGKILAEENTLVSPLWHYSTEIRLVYQTIFTMPLFKLLGSFENWALIRSLNIILNNLVLLLSYFFMMKQMKIQAKWILISGFFLVVPVSFEYWNIVTFGGYYIFFISQLFCCLGLFAALASHTGTVKTALPAFILLLLLSFALGAQGIRTLYVIHLPLLIACIAIKKKYPLLLGCTAFAACLAGLAVNYLLHFKYFFQSFENMRMENPVNFFSKFGQSLASLAGFFGLSGGSPLLSGHGFFSVAAITGTFILFWAVYKACRRNIFLPIFFAASALCNIFIFVAGSISITSRYFIPFMVLYVPLTALLFEHAEKVYGHTKRAALICGIVLFICGKSFLGFQDLAARDSNTIRKDHIQYLLDNRLNYGFATYLNANITTELSGGKIEIASLEPSRVNSGRSMFRMHNYLIPVKFFDPLYHRGESFLLLSREEWDSIRNRRRGAVLSKPDYEDRNFVILRYPSAEAIHRELLERE